MVDRSVAPLAQSAIRVQPSWYRRSIRDPGELTVTGYGIWPDGLRFEAAPSTAQRSFDGPPRLIHRKAGRLGGQPGRAPTLPKLAAARIKMHWMRRSGFLRLHRIKRGPIGMLIQGSLHESRVFVG